MLFPVLKLSHELWASRLPLCVQGRSAQVHYKVRTRYLIDRSAACEPITQSILFETNTHQIRFLKRILTPPPPHPGPGLGPEGPGPLWPQDLGGIFEQLGR